MIQPRPDPAPHPSHLDLAALDPAVAAVVADLPPVFTGEAHRVTAPMSRRAAFRGVEERLVHGPPLGPSDPPVPVRLHLPPGRRSPSPAVMFLHGGAFVGGSAADADAPLRRLARSTGVVVVAPSYRLAPADPHPAPARDVQAVWRWLRAVAPGLGVDPARLAVFGYSAGGALAAGLCLRLRDTGEAPPTALLLGAPMLDDRVLATEEDLQDPRVLNRAYVIAAWQAHLGGRTGGSVPAEAAPARASDLAGLPPTVITACDVDPLRQEAVDFARRLTDAGVPTRLHVFGGTVHGSVGLAPDAPPSRAEMAVYRDALAALTERHAPATGPGPC